MSAPLPWIDIEVPSGAAATTSAIWTRTIASGGAVASRIVIVATTPVSIGFAFMPTIRHLTDPAELVQVIDFPARTAEGPTCISTDAKSLDGYLKVHSNPDGRLALPRSNTSTVALVACGERLPGCKVKDICWPMPATGSRSAVRHPLLTPVPSLSIKRKGLASSGFRRSCSRVSEFPGWNQAIRQPFRTAGLTFGTCALTRRLLRTLYERQHFGMSCRVFRR